MCHLQSTVTKDKGLGNTNISCFVGVLDVRDIKNNKNENVPRDFNFIPAGALSSFERKYGIITMRDKQNKSRLRGRKIIVMRHNISLWTKVCIENQYGDPKTDLNY